MKNLLILVIVVFGIVMFGTYTKPDDSVTQSPTDFEQLAPQITALKEQQSEVSLAATSIENTEGENRQIIPKNVSLNKVKPETVSKTSHELNSISAEIPAPEVADVIKPEADRIVTKIRGTKHQDTYSTTDLLDITRSNEDRFQQIYKMINSNH